MTSLVSLGRDHDPFYWDVWDPFDIGAGAWPMFETGRRTRGREEGGGGGGGAVARTPVDWRETANVHIFRVDIPGLKREEVKVHVEDGNVLEITGERAKDEGVEATDTWHRRERCRVSFRRRFRLPESANMDAVQCALDHGVLTVTVPKKEAASGCQRNIRAVAIS